MSLFTKKTVVTADEALAEVARLREARTGLAKRAADARVEADRRRAGLGEAELEAFLAGGEPSAERAQILQAEAEVQASEAATAALLPRLEAAGKRLAMARANVVRGEAKELENKLAAHLKERDTLLEKLKACEGCDYLPDTASRGSFGVVDGRTVPLGDNFLPPAPKSATLAAELQGLLARADAIESARIFGPGAVSGQSLAELLEAVRSRPDTELPPTEAEVSAWYEVASGDAARRWKASQAENDPTPMPPVIYSLMWTAGGSIDRKQSVLQYSREPSAEVTERDRARLIEEARIRKAREAGPAAAFSHTEKA